MTLLAVLFPAFQVAIALAASLTALRLLRFGLYRRYPVLGCYLAFVALYSLSPVLLDGKSPTYFWIWIYAQPIQWLIEILLVRELCHIVLERHPGLVTLGRWMMYFGVATSAFLSCLSLLPHFTSTMSARSKLLGYWIAANRGISLSLVIFLLLMLLAVSRYPVRLSRNVVLNALLFTLCFMCDSLGAILKAVFDVSLSPWVTISLSGVESVCLVVWLVLLTPEGEKLHLDWVQFGPEYEARALSRLDAVNRVLLRRDNPA